MMRIRISLKPEEWKTLLACLHQAYAEGRLRLVKRIHALIYILTGKTVEEVGQILGLSESAVYGYLNAFILRRFQSLVYRRPSGRPPKLTQSQRKELAEWIDEGPEAAGYDCGCWNTALIQDLILVRFGVEYNPHYLAQLLKNMGYSYQKARFVSDHLDEVAQEREKWDTVTWPEIVRLAQEKGAMLLFGDECSFAQWGSLSYTWAKRGQQPTAKTSGKRKAYKVFGLIEFFTGLFFYKAHTGKFTSVSYQAFVSEVLAQTTQHLILIQDGARYHTSKAMKAFFAAHADRITVYPLPRYSPEFNPIEYLWRNVKKLATHLRYFPKFEDLVAKVNDKLQYLAGLPAQILGLMGRYCKTLGTETIS
jgi:transposase